MARAVIKNAVAALKQQQRQTKGYHHRRRKGCRDASRNCSDEHWCRTQIQRGAEEGPHGGGDKQAARPRTSTPHLGPGSGKSRTRLNDALVTAPMRAGNACGEDLDVSPQIPNDSILTKRKGAASGAHDVEQTNRRETARDRSSSSGEGEVVVDRSQDATREHLNRRQAANQRSREGESPAQRKTDGFAADADARACVDDGASFPTALLRREQEALQRRRERELAARLHEQDILKLSSSFRATEVNRCITAAGKTFRLCVCLVAQGAWFGSQRCSSPQPHHK